MVLGYWLLVSGRVGLVACFCLSVVVFLDSTPCWVLFVDCALSYGGCWLSFVGCGVVWYCFLVGDRCALFVVCYVVRVVLCVWCSLMFWSVLFGVCCLLFVFWGYVLCLVFGVKMCVVSCFAVYVGCCVLLWVRRVLTCVR